MEQCKDMCFKLLRWVSQALEKFKRLLAKGRALFSWIAWLFSKFLKGEKPEVAEPQQEKTPEQKLCTRIRALKSWLVLREKEFESGQACGICKRRHSKIEYNSGYVDDGSGQWNCMGWGVVKLHAREDSPRLRRREGLVPRSGLRGVEGVPHDSDRCHLGEGFSGHPFHLGR